MRPKKPESISILSLSRPGRNSLSCTTPCLILAFFADANQIERVLQRVRHRLLAIDVLAGLHRLLQQLGAKLRGRGVEEQRVLLVLERLVEVGGPARDAVRLGELRHPVGVAPDQDRVGHHPVAVLQRHAALVADRADRADQVLVHAHASGDAVHDDAEPLLRHGCSPESVLFSTTAAPLDGRAAA